MKKFLFLFLPFLISLSACLNGDGIGISAEKEDYFFTGDVNGELLDLHTSSEDTLLTARVTSGASPSPGTCARDYISKIYKSPFGAPNVEIGLMHFFNGDCNSQEEIDAFDDAFAPGVYPFNVYTISDPNMERSVSILIQISGAGFYDSERADNANAYFEITSSEDASDNFYKKRIVEGKLSCKLKKTTSSDVVQLENVTFKILVSVEKP